MNRIALLVSCLAVLTACDQKEKAAKPPPKPVAGKAPVAAEKPRIGIEAPGNDAAIVALAKKALTCKWEGSAEKAFSAFVSDCAELKAWQEEKDLFAEKKGEPTLVAMIEDPDEKVRFLAEKRLDDDLGLLKDNKLAARVLAVAEKNEVLREMGPLGAIVGATVLEDPALFPRIKALLTESDTDLNLRNAVMTDLLPSNPDNADVFALTREATKSVATPNDKNVARTALGAFSKLQTDKPARCEVWLENIESTDVDHAGDAMQWMTASTAHCAAQFEAVLKSLDARVKAKTATSTFFVMSLERICDPKNAAKPPQVKQALGLAKKLADDKKLEARVRAGALEAAVACDPKGGKAYAGKFKKEKDQDFKDALFRINKKKK